MTPALLRDLQERAREVVEAASALRDLLCRADPRLLEALSDAETKSDVMIKGVYVGVTGAHIQSFNNRGCVILPDDNDEIDEQDIEDVKINAREVSIPAQNAFLHSIIQHYHVDGQDGVLNPADVLVDGKPVPRKGRIERGARVPGIGIAIEVPA